MKFIFSILGGVLSFGYYEFLLNEKHKNEILETWKASFNGLKTYNLPNLQHLTLITAKCLSQDVLEKAKNLTIVSKFIDSFICKKLIQYWHSFADDMEQDCAIVFLSSEQENNHLNPMIIPINKEDEELFNDCTQIRYKHENGITQREFKQVSVNDMSKFDIKNEKHAKEYGIKIVNSYDADKTEYLNTQHNSSEVLNPNQDKDLLTAGDSPDFAS